MVHDQRYLPYLLGLGIREISLDARFVPRIQRFIQELDLSQAKEMTQQLLHLNTVEAIENSLRKDSKVFENRKKFLTKI
jgi:phosphotransferase system enzyme I (PtsP)